VKVNCIYFIDLFPRLAEEIHPSVIKTKQNLAGDYKITSEDIIKWRTFAWSQSTSGRVEKVVDDPAAA
jgi:hypothetical protein